jgi:hypothetical protein
LDLSLIHDWPGAALMRRSAVAYAAVNAAHILGMGLLVGAALPMDLRLLGAFRRVPMAVVVPFLARLAGAGLVLAVVTGAMLWSVSPAGYLDNPAFRVKLALLAGALAMVAIQHANPAFRAVADGAAPALSVRVAAALSAVLWLAIIGAGRWIGFA